MRLMPGRGCNPPDATSPHRLLTNTGVSVARRVTVMHGTPVTIPVAASTAGWAWLEPILAEARQEYGLDENAAAALLSFSRKALCGCTAVVAVCELVCESFGVGGDSVEVVGGAVREPGCADGVQAGVPGSAVSRERALG